MLLMQQHKESPKHHVEGEPDTKGYRLYHPIYIKSTICKPNEEIRKTVWGSGNDLFLVWDIQRFIQAPKLLKLNT